MNKNTMSDLKQIEIPFSRAKLGKLLMYTVPLCLMGFGFIILWQAVLSSPDEPVAFNGIVIQLCGAAIILLFGGLTVRLLLEFYSKEPGLVLSSDGVTNNTSELAAGFIPWDNVASVICMSAGMQSSCNLVLKDANAHLAGMNGLKRWFLKMNMKSTGPQEIIRSNKLDIDHDRLVALFNEYCPRDGEEIEIVVQG